MSIMNSKEKKARERGRKQGYIKAVNDMVDNLIRNSRTEIIDGKISLIVTEERFKIIAKKMIANIQLNNKLKFRNKYLSR